MDEHDFIGGMCLADNGRVPFPIRDFSPDAVVPSFDFCKASGSHIPEVARELVIWPIKRHQLHNVTTISHDASDGFQSQQRFSKVGICSSFATVTEIIEGSTLPVVATGDPIGSRGLTPPVNLPAMVQNMNTWVRRTCHYQRYFPPPTSKDRRLT